MGKSEMEKFNQVMLLLKNLAESLSTIDPVYVELATALACTGRARRLLLERPGQVIS